MIRLGWKAGPENGPLDLLDGAVAADQYGFDLMDISYPAIPESGAGQFSFNWAWLGAAAAKTQYLHLGPGVSCAALRSDAAVIAQAAQTLAVVAAGRSYISINLAECLLDSSDEEGWIDQNEQQAMAAEAISLIRQLWNGQPVTFNGHFFQTRKARINTHCDLGVPIYLALDLPGTAYFAGFYGDGLIAAGGMRPQVYRRILQEFARGAREAGKDPYTMPRMVTLPVSYHRAEDLDMETVFQVWGSDLFVSQPCDVAYIPVTATGNRQAFVEPHVEKTICASSYPGEHAALAEAYINMGFNTLLIRPVGCVLQEFIRAYGRDILPLIRASSRDRS